MNAGNQIRCIATFILCFASCAQAEPGIAATPDASSPLDSLEQIVVTSERRSERISDVPMSVQAFGQENLDQMGVRDIDTLARVSPGVTFLRNGTSGTANYNDEGSDISIRGIESTAGAATIGIYVDDTPIQTRHLNFGTVNPFPALFDLERVEVLKGPQGTLFGSGSEGGTIRFITPEPGLTRYSGSLRAEYGKIDGGGNNYEAGFAVGGPIIDEVLGFRVSASFRRDGGWVDRVRYLTPPSTIDPNSGGALYTTVPTVADTTEQNSNWHDTATFRAALKWKPTDNVTIDPTFYVQTLHINDTGAYWLNISDPAHSRYYNGNLLRDASTDPWWIAAAKISWDPSWASLVSNTSYFSRQQHATTDLTQLYATLVYLNQYPPTDGASPAYYTDHQYNFNQEIRLSSKNPNAPLQWTVGLFYTHTYENSTDFAYSPIANPTPPYLEYGQPRFSVVDKQAAIFGELGWKVTEDLKASVGLRYSNLKYDGQVVENVQGALGSLHINTPSSGSAHPLTPRFVLSYAPTAGSLYYASAAKGFRPGGINTELPATCLPTGLDQSAAEKPYSPDTLWQYEVGSKQTLFDSRLNFGMSLYLIKWKDIQQFVYLACGLGYTYNLGQVTSRGGEFDVHWSPVRGLNVGLTAAYTDARYDRAVTLPGGADQLVATGDHLPASPWNLDLNFEYSLTVSDKSPYLRLDYQYATAQKSLIAFQDPANIPNADPTQPGLPQIRLLNARAGVRFGGADFSLFATNLLNYHAATFVARDFPTDSYGLAHDLDNNYFGHGYAPRTLGVTTTYRF